MEATPLEQVVVLAEAMKVVCVLTVAFLLGLFTKTLAKAGEETTKVATARHKGAKLFMD